MIIALTIIAVAFLCIFTMQNMAPISVALFSIEFYVPLAFVVILAFLVGLLLGIVKSRIDAFKTAKQHKKELKEAETLQNKSEYEKSILQQKVDEMTRKEQERARQENEALKNENSQDSTDNKQE